MKVPPFRVEYYCPRQSLSWQSGLNRMFANFQVACGWAQSLKPNSLTGHARVIDARGLVVYFI